MDIWDLLTLVIMTATLMLETAVFLWALAELVVELSTRKSVLARIVRASFQHPTLENAGEVFLYRFIVLGVVMSPFVTVALTYALSMGAWHN